MHMARRIKGKIYVHERAGWPDFRWDHARISALLVDVRHRQGRLIGRMEGLGFQLRAEAVLHSLTEEVLKSSDIEGEKLDRDQVRSSIARRLGIKIGGLLPADRDVEGVVEMMLDATQHYDQPLTGRRLFDWHAALFPTGRSGMAKINVAAWRDDKTGPMQVVSGPIGKERVHYEAPAADRVRPEMKKFLDWFEKDNSTDLVVKSGVAHLWFVTIHPFDSTAMAASRAQSPTWFSPVRSEARSAFTVCPRRSGRNAKPITTSSEATQKGDLDITHWLEWFLGCLSRAFEHAETILAAVLNKARFWERFAGVKLNERQRDIVNRLLNGFEGKLTSSKWAKLAKCSQDTALRDIADLTQKKVLVKDEAGGRSTSYSLARLK